jgi:N-methylhydantoinase B/oxoprolinase/acetone carboxylase alpha subunit
MGGRKGQRGISGVHTHMSNTRNTPVEALEHYLPMRITAYRLREDSGGDGLYAGGDGIVREYEVLTPTSVTLLSERRESAPYGAPFGDQSGSPGRCGHNSVTRAGGRREDLPAKVRLELAPGDRLRIETPGGGGYGRPSSTKTLATQLDAENT